MLRYILSFLFADASYESLFQRIMESPDISETDKRYIVRIHNVFKKWIGRTLFCKEISSESRQQYEHFLKSLFVT